MKKHSFYIPERMINQLKEISKEEEISVSELIRRYIDEKMKSMKEDKTIDEVIDEIMDEE